jgi:hypothetical protein
LAEAEALGFDDLAVGPKSRRSMSTTVSHESGHAKTPAEEEALGWLAQRLCWELQLNHLRTAWAAQPEPAAAIGPDCATPHRKRSAPHCSMDHPDAA